MEELHVQALGYTGGNPARCSSPLAMVIELRHTHASGVNISEPMYGQVQPGNVDTTVAARHVSVSDGGRYVV